MFKFSMIFSLFSSLALMGMQLFVSAAIHQMETRVLSIGGFNAMQEVEAEKQIANDEVPKQSPPFRSPAKDDDLVTIPICSVCGQECPECKCPTGCKCQLEKDDAIAVMAAQFLLPKARPNNAKIFDDKDLVPISDCKCGPGCDCFRAMLKGFCKLCNQAKCACKWEQCKATDGEWEWVKRAPDKAVKSAVKMGRYVTTCGPLGCTRVWIADASGTVPDPNSKSNDDGKSKPVESPATGQPTIQFQQYQTMPRYGVFGRRR